LPNHFVINHLATIGTLLHKAGEGFMS
jgi:hypothetical protein